MTSNPFKIESKANSKGSLEGKYRVGWVEESFDVDKDSSDKISISHTRSYIGTSINSNLLLIFFCVIIFGLTAIIVRSAELQIIKGEYYRTQADGNRIRRIPIPAERGIISDRFGKELVHNIPGFSLGIVPQDIPHDPVTRSKLLSQVATISDTEKEFIASQLAKYSAYSYESFPIKDNLSYQSALKLYVQNANLPGVEIESGSNRGYYSLNTKVTSTKEYTPSLSHIIGYVGRLNDSELKENAPKGYLPTDNIGKTGIEKQYETFLRGTFGRKKIEVNSLGKEQNILAVEAPVPGKNIMLSLDLEGQQKLEALVKETANRTNNKRIAAIAMDPNNGEIIAMVSWPAFDNNKFVQGLDQKTYESYITDTNRPLFNRAISGLYPPGSTVKLVVAAAALQEKVATIFTSVNSVGGIEVGDKFFKDWKAGGHGYTNVTKALAWSVNTYFYYVGGGFEKFIGLGIDRLAQYMKNFGIASKTNIDIPGEQAGFVPSRDWKKTTKGESWYVGDTYNLSIGQGDLLVTPLQVAVWTAAVANSGNLVTPHFGKKITDPLTKTESILTFPTRHIEAMDEDNLRVVQQGMRDCVTYGSCKMLGGLSFTSAGKTGTAQWSKTRPTHAWFTSYAPYLHPQIVVTVLVEDGGEGSIVAEPIAESFLRWWGAKYLK